MVVRLPKVQRGRNLAQPAMLNSYKPDTEPWKPYMALCKPCVFISVYLSISLPTYQPIHLPLYASICHLSINLSAYPLLSISICLSIYLSIYLSLYTSVHVSISLSVYSSTCLSVCPSIEVRLRERRCALQGPPSCLPPPAECCRKSYTVCTGSLLLHQHCDCIQGILFGGSWSVLNSELRRAGRWTTFWHWPQSHKFA